MAAGAMSVERFRLGHAELVSSVPHAGRSRERLQGFGKKHPGAADDEHASPAPES
jgi:hypothetical protein